MTPTDETLLWLILLGMFLWIMYLQGKTEKLEIRIRDLG